MGKKIKIARIKKGLKTKDLAAKVGVTAQYLSDIERGKYKNPSLKLLRKIATELDIAILELIE